MINAINPKVYYGIPSSDPKKFIFKSCLSANPSEIKFYNDMKNVEIDFRNPCYCAKYEIVFLIYKRKPAGSVDGYILMCTNNMDMFGSRRRTFDVLTSREYNDILLELIHSYKQNEKTILDDLKNKFKGIDAEYCFSLDISKATERDVTMPTIESIIYNDPATIVYWSDKTKTVVKANGNDTFNKEIGLSMAISKKYCEMFSNEGPRGYFLKMIKDAKDLTYKTKEKKDKRSKNGTY